jgi:hypothetical protein
MQGPVGRAVVHRERMIARAQPGHEVNLAWCRTDRSLPKLPGNGNSGSLAWMTIAWDAGLGGHEVETAADVIAKVGADADAFPAQVQASLVTLHAVQSDLGLVHLVADVLPSAMAILRGQDQVLVFAVAPVRGAVAGAL